jgi:hypothetical protein
MTLFVVSHISTHSLNAGSIIFIFFFFIRKFTTFHSRSLLIKATCFGLDKMARHTTALFYFLLNKNKRKAVTQIYVTIYRLNENTCNVNAISNQYFHGKLLILFFYFIKTKKTVIQSCDRVIVCFSVRTT